MKPAGLAGPFARPEVKLGSLRRVPIASELAIPVRTVESHVQHILDKLGFSSRAQIAGWSAARPPAP